MKRIIFLSIALTALLSAAPVKAQAYYSDPCNEIYASYGVSVIGSSIGLVMRVSNVMAEFANLSGLDENSITVKQGGSRGIVNLGYSYQVNRTFAFGANAGFNRMSVTLTDKTAKVAPYALNLYTIMGTAKANWFRNPSFGMYSKAGLGVMIAGYDVMEGDKTGSVVLPTAHLSLIGMEVGRDFCGFMELGAGFQGIVQLGLKYYF